MEHFRNLFQSNLLIHPFIAPANKIFLDGWSGEITKKLKTLDCTQPAGVNATVYSICEKGIMAKNIDSSEIIHHYNVFFPQTLRVKIKSNDKYTAVCYPSLSDLYIVLLEGRNVIYTKFLFLSQLSHHCIKNEIKWSLENRKITTGDYDDRYDFINIYPTLDAKIIVGFVTLRDLPTLFFSYDLCDEEIGYAEVFTDIYYPYQVKVNDKIPNLKIDGKILDSEVDGKILDSEVDGKILDSNTDGKIPESKVSRKLSNPMIGVSELDRSLITFHFAYPCSTLILGTNLLTRKNRPQKIFRRAKSWIEVLEINSDMAITLCDRDEFNPPTLNLCRLSDLDSPIQSITLDPLIQSTPLDPSIESINNCVLHHYLLGYVKINREKYIIYTKHSYEDKSYDSHDIILSWEYSPKIPNFPKFSFIICVASKQVYMIKGEIASYYSLSKDGRLALFYRKPFSSYSWRKHHTVTVIDLLTGKKLWSREIDQDLNEQPGVIEWNYVSVTPETRKQFRLLMMRVSINFIPELSDIILDYFIESF